MFLSRFRWSAKRLRLLHDSLGSVRLGSVLATVDWGLAPCAPASSCPKSFVLAAQHSQMPGIIIYELFTLSIFCSCYDQSNRRTDDGTMGRSVRCRCRGLGTRLARLLARSLAGAANPFFVAQKLAGRNVMGDRFGQAARQFAHLA